MDIFPKIPMIGFEDEGARIMIKSSLTINFTESEKDEINKNIAHSICRSGKFETGQGTCAIVCMDQLGAPRKFGCRHAPDVHKILADCIINGLWGAVSIEFVGLV